MASAEEGYPESRFSASVDEDLHCAICLNVLRDPLQCEMNEHHFCAPCIKRHLGNSRKCPSCMEDLSVATLRKPARYLTRHLSSLKMHCEFEGRGCPELVNLEDLPRHLDICGYAPVSCHSCNAVVNKHDKIRHETEICELRKTKCHDCAEVRKEIGELKVSFEELKNQVCQIMDSKISIKDSSNKSHENAIVVVGGCSAFSRLCSSEMYVWSEKKWLPLPKTSQVRSGSSAIVFENQIIVAGGRIGVQDFTHSIEAIKVDRKPMQWFNFPAKLPHASSGHNCIAYQDRLIVIGGKAEFGSAYNLSDRIYEVCLRPPYTCKLLSYMPKPRDCHRAELLGQQIVVIGGISKSLPCKQYENSVLLFDINTNKCKEISQLPYAMDNMATVTWGNHVVLIGGSSSSGEVLNTVTMYDIKTGNTHMLPPMKYNRSHCTAVVINNVIVVMGGYDSNKKIFLNVVESFSFATYTWTELPPMNEPRSSATSVVVPVNL